MAREPQAATSSAAVTAPKPKRKVKPPAPKKVYVMVSDPSIKDKIVAATIDPFEVLSFIEEGKAVAYTPVEVWVARQKPKVAASTNGQ